MRSAQHRILSLSAALTWRAALQRDRRTLAATNGCFDLLHAGHVASLAAARGEADALVVLLNSDASVRALKGPTRPIYDQAARATVLASLRAVDAVVIFEGTDCAAELAALAPEVYAKSAEYEHAQHPAEKAALERCGATLVWLARDERYSTTAAIRDASGGRGDASPRTPPSRAAAADGLGDSPVAVAPVAAACGRPESASRPQDPGAPGPGLGAVMAPRAYPSSRPQDPGPSQRPTAGCGDAAAPSALLTSSAASAAPCNARGPGSQGAPAAGGRLP